MDGTGQYRTRGADGGTHTAFVSDRSVSFHIGEQLYRWRGYVPDFDALPWSSGATPPRGQATSRRSRS